MAFAYLCPKASGPCWESVKYSHTYLSASDRYGFHAQVGMVSLVHGAFKTENSWNIAFFEKCPFTIKNVLSRFKMSFHAPFTLIHAHPLSKLDTRDTERPQPRTNPPGIQISYACGSRWSTGWYNLVHTKPLVESWCSFVQVYGFNPPGSRLKRNGQIQCPTWSTSKK